MGRLLHVRARALVALAVAAVLLGGCLSVTDYAAPGVDPWGTAFDGGGQVWVALPGCDPGPKCATTTPPGKLARFDPASHTWSATVTLPSGYGQPLFVAVAGSGKVWFTMPVTNAIGVWDPASSTLAQWAVPTPGGGPWGLAIDHNGKIWFTEHYVNKIGSFDPSTQHFQEISTPSTISDPYGITVDATNNIWFTENPDAVALIAEYTTGGVLKEYKIRNTATSGTGLTPHLITIDGSGNPWWSEGFASAIGTLNLAAAQPGTNSGVTEYHYTPACGGCGSHTSGIAFDHKSLMWLDDSLQNTFGSFPVGGGSFTFYNSPGSHPHDGLNVDAQNHVWFDEEFANKLAEAIPDPPGGSSTASAPSTTSTGTAAAPATGSNGSARVAMADRTLTVGKAVRGQGLSPDSVSVRVDLTVDNPGPGTITTSDSDFRLMGPEGDIFAAKPDSSGSIAGAIGPHGSRLGSVSFEVPAAAASGLHLLSHAGLASPTVLIPLNLG